MPKGVYKRAHRGPNKKYATPLRGRAPARRKAAPVRRKASVKRAVQTRTSAKGIVLDKFKGLEQKIEALQAQVKHLHNLQVAAFIDNYRAFYLKTQGSASVFAEMLPDSFNELGLSVEDLEDAVKEYKDEPEAPVEIPVPTEPAHTQLDLL